MGEHAGWNGENKNGEEDASAKAFLPCPLIESLWLRLDGRLDLVLPLLCFEARPRGVVGVFKGDPGWS